MICNDRACGCAINSSTLDITGSGTPADPWVIEQLEFTILTQILADIANLVAGMETLPGTYLIKAGDTATGPIIFDVPGSGAGVVVRNAIDGPFVSFLRQDGTQIGYVGGFHAESLMRLWAQTGIGIRFGTNNAERARIDVNGILMIGKTATAIATTGVEERMDGQIWSTAGSAGDPNHILNRTGAADANGQPFASFRSANTGIGSITRATASTVAYNTSSDEELKQRIEPLDDQLALYWMRIVQPMLFEYIRTPGDQHVGYIAQRIAAAWPESVSLGIVTPGHGDVTKRTFDHDGNETTPKEVWEGWQIDLTKFTPFVHASLRAVDVRVSILEDIIAEHSLRLEALEAETTDLREDLTGAQAVIVTLSEKVAALDKLVVALGKPK